MSRIKLSMPLPPELTDWLGDVFPAWLQLPQEAFYKMIPFNAAESPIQIQYSEHAAEIGRSHIFTNLNVFLTLISEGRVCVDPDSTLTSDSLELLLQTTHWPNYDYELIKRLSRPLHEGIIGPLDFLKALALECDLIQIEEDRIEIRDNGLRMLKNQTDVALVRRVFEAIFSKVNPRNLTKLAHPWVQEQSGIMLWALSITADKPRSAKELTRYCFVPPQQFFDHRLSTLDIYMRAVFLAPLTWLGLLETQTVEASDANVQGLLYKKTALFDQFIQFDFERLQPVERAN
jgi:hypothetical protein